jgi:hypothetical protein
MQARFRNATVSEMAMRKFELLGTAVLLLAAAPAWAGNSTAAERKATRELNQQQSQMAAPALADASATLPDNSPPASAPTAKVESANISQDSAATLSSLTNPPSKIASANVLDASGQTIGAVQRVEVTPQGQPTKVSVALLGKDEKMVVLDAGAVKYDASRNEITSQEAGDQIRSRAS